MHGAEAAHVPSTDALVPDMEVIVARIELKNSVARSLPSNRQQRLTRPGPAVTSVESDITVGDEDGAPCDRQEAKRQPPIG
jgi:hypothetical protein